MKNLFVITTTVILLCTASIVTNFVKTNDTNKKIEIKPITETVKYKYEIKDYKGRIAVFVYGKELPVEIFEIYTDSLPNEDSAMIKNGINISNEKELQEKIEELTG